MRNSAGFIIWVGFMNQTLKQLVASRLVRAALLLDEFQSLKSKPNPPETSPRRSRLFIPQQKSTRLISIVSVKSPPAKKLPDTAQGVRQKIKICPLRGPCQGTYPPRRQLRPGMPHPSSRNRRNRCVQLCLGFFVQTEILRVGGIPAPHTGLCLFFRRKTSL